MIVSIGAIVVLLVLSAFFSGAETALTAASRPYMHQLEQTGERRAGLVNRLRERKERLIGALLFGNNVVNILASALATQALLAAFGDAGVAYATLGMTVLVLIFGEILPKTYAFQDPNRVALAIAPVVSVVVKVLAPVTRTINAVIRAVFQLFGADFHGDHVLATSADELRGAIELHGTDAAAVKEERAMLHSVLDLPEVEVGEIMTHRKDVVAIDADDPPERIVAEVLESPYTRIPVWRGDPDNILGVLHAKALLRAIHGRGADLAGIDVAALAAPPWFIPEYTSLLDQLQAFRRRHEHFALVVDEYGSLMGIVTLEDILEEIVGDISDEHDVDASAIRAEPDGSYVVQGAVTIRDLNRELDWRLPDEDASTVAGLVLYESRRIPDVGQVFRFHGFRFEILRRERHRITEIRVTPPTATAEETPSTD